MRKNKHLLVFLLYTLIISVFYAQVVLGNKTLLPALYEPQGAGLSLSDYRGRMPVNTFKRNMFYSSLYEAPLNNLMRNTYRKGQIPLWNPYQGLGSPLVGQVSSAFFPYQVLKNISPWWLGDYFSLGRPIIAAFFTYLFLSLLGLSLAAAFLGGIFYGLGGSFSWFINFEQFGNLAMTLPVFLFSLERYIQLKTKRRFYESAIVFALLILAAQFSSGLLIFLWGGVYYLLRICAFTPQQKATSVAAAAAGGRTIKPGNFPKRIFLQGGLGFLGLAVFALALSSFYLLPMWQLYHFFGFRKPVLIFDFPLLRSAIALFIPQFFEVAGHPPFFLQKAIWDYLGGYSGICVLYLVLLGIWLKGSQRKYFIFFAIFGALTCFVNFDFLFLPFICAAPFLRQWGIIRWSGPLWNFSFACAAACAIEALRNKSFELEEKRRLLWVIFRLTVFILGFLLWKAIYILKHNLLLEEINNLYFYISGLGGIFAGLLVLFFIPYILTKDVRKKNILYAFILLAIFEFWFYLPKGMDILYASLRFIPLLLSMSVVLYIRSGKPLVLARGASFCLKNKRYLAQAMLVLVVIIYTLLDCLSPRGFPEKYNLFKENKHIAFLKKDKGFARLIAEDSIFMPNLSSAYGLFDIRYISAWTVPYYSQYVESRLKKPHFWLGGYLWLTGDNYYEGEKVTTLSEAMQGNLLFYSFLGLKYILTARDVNLSLPLLYDGELRVYVNPAAFPRVFVVRTFQMASDYLQAQALMARLGPALRETAVLQESPPSWHKNTAPENEQDLVRIEDYTPNTVSIAAQLKSDGLLVLTDLYYPGWKAFVDKKETKIYQVDGLVRGVFLGKGSHNVVFRYSPASFKLGVALSVISLICALFFLKPSPKAI